MQRTGAQPPRDLRIDALRGIALWFIFLDHVPNNAFDWLTIRNYGFSDTTELFFFVSGFTCALAYGRILREEGPTAALAHALRRSFEIYAAFLLLVLFYVAAVAAVGGGHPYADETNTAPFFAAPVVAVLRLISLQYMPVNTDVLPTFVLLHLLCVPLILLLRRQPAVALAGSLAIYGAVQLTGLNLPTWPKGQWFFNPFAWQILFVLGAWIAIRSDRDRLMEWVRSSRPLLWTAVIYLAASLIIALTWKIEQLKWLVPEAIGPLIYPMEKSSLSALRLLHFLALAVVASRLLPRAIHAARPPLLWLVWCGENSLLIYCFGVLAAFAGLLALREVSEGVAMQLLVSVLGIAASIGGAGAASWMSGRAQSPPKLF